MTPQAPRFAALLADPAQTAAMLRILSNPDRLAILCFLAAQEQAVSAIGEALNLRQPALSQQLADLRDNGLVTTRRQSRQVYYAVASPRILAVLDALNAGLAGLAYAAPDIAPAPRPVPVAPRTGEAAHFARVAKMGAD